MHVFLTLVITVNDQIEVVPGLGDQRDKLLTGTGGRTDIIHQRQITIRCKRGGVYRLIHAVHHKEKEHRQEFFINDSALFFLLQHINVVLVHIASLLRNHDLIPVTVLADHLHLFAGKQVTDDLIFRAGAGAQIQIAFDLAADRSIRSVCFHVCSGPLPVTKGEGKVAVLIHVHLIGELFLLRIRGIRCCTFRNCRRLRFTVIVFSRSCKAGSGQRTKHQDSYRKACHHSLNIHSPYPPCCSFQARLPVQDKRRPCLSQPAQ